MSYRWLPLLVLLLSTPATAHEWYPFECCHEMDCAPVEHVSHVQDQLFVTTRLGSVMVPASFPRRESKDNRMHVCMRPGVGGAMRLICIFLPPPS
jgi:hypothetical protein